MTFSIEFLYHKSSLKIIFAQLPSMGREREIVPKYLLSAKRLRSFVWWLGMRINRMKNEILSRNREKKAHQAKSPRTFLGKIFFCLHSSRLHLFLERSLV